MAGPRGHHPPPPDHSRAYRVVDGLFISGHPDHAHDFISKGVDVVVDLEGDVDESTPQKEGGRDPLVYAYWPIKDEPRLPDEEIVRGIASFVARLLDDGKEVLVHCRSGHNRSGMVCARALMSQGMSADDAIEKVRAGRRDGKALTNESFVEWLRREEENA